MTDSRHWHLGFAPKTRDERSLTERDYWEEQKDRAKLEARFTPQETDNDREKRRPGTDSEAL
jgi:hypothetical protein